MNKNRNKGHRFELQIRKMFEQYFPLVKTARQVSRAMDDCGIDLVNIPFNVQCKSGYEKTNFKFAELSIQTKELLKKFFTLDNPVHNYPYLIIHKRGRKEEETTVTMSLRTFEDLLKRAYEQTRT